MLRALYSSATGMKAQEFVIDVTANNLANVNTNGFKRSMVDFADLMYVTGKQAGTEGHDRSADADSVPDRQRRPCPVGTTKSFNIGTFRADWESVWTPPSKGTGSSKSICRAATIRYTRDGSFKIDSQGQPGDVRRLPAG